MDATMDLFDYLLAFALRLGAAALVILAGRWLAA